MMLRYKNILLLLVVLLLIALPPMLLPDSEFEGTDDLAEEAIGEINPSYEPWFEPLWEPGSEEAEKWIFVFQATLGGAFIAYYFWSKKRKNELSTD